MADRIQEIRGIISGWRRAVIWLAAKGHGQSNVIAGAIRDWSNPMSYSKTGAGRIVSP